MRRVRSRALPVLLLGATLALTGCAQPGGPGTAGPAGSGSAGPTGTSSSGAPAASHCPGGIRTGTVSLTENDSGSICVATGTHLEIYLHGTRDDQWSDPGPDHSIPDSDTVLRLEASGKGALQVGVTAGFFVAAHPGQVVVSAARGASQRFRLAVAVY